jgi:calcium-dependent protein kinase
VIGRLLGEGTYAVVKEGIHKQSQIRRAIKFIEKVTLNSDETAVIMNEIEILSQIDHPNIVKLYEFYNNSE